MGRTSTFIRFRPHSVTSPRRSAECLRAQRSACPSSCGSTSTWGFNDDPSPPSNQICTDPEKTASQADLALQNIRGKQDPLAPETYAYLILLDNNSANDAKDVTVDLATSGVATFGDQGLVAPGWAAGGFNCAPRPPAGGESSAITCTGGDPEGQGPHRSRRDGDVQQCRLRDDSCTGERRRRHDAGQQRHRAHPAARPEDRASRRARRAPGAWSLGALPFRSSRTISAWVTRCAKCG